LRDIINERVDVENPMGLDFFKEFGFDVWVADVVDAIREEVLKELNLRVPEEQLKKILGWLKKRTAKGCQCQSCLDGNELIKEVEETLEKEKEKN